jgi:hypothetical protein
MRLAVAAIATLLLGAAVASAAGPPPATTGSATNIGQTTATVAGTVGPQGMATTYHVEYGTSTSYGLQTSDQDAGTGTGAIDVQVALSGLTSATTYHYRVVATNAAGVDRGSDRTFTTAGAPGASTGTARNVTTTGARLTASVDPNALATTYRFEYGTTTSYGKQTASASAGSGASAVAVGANVSDLQPHTRYHYRVVATNEAGTGASGDHTFVTDRLPTSVTLQLEERRTVWGEGIEVFGTVSGSGVNSIPVGLERQDFPYAFPFTAAGTPLPVRADRRGNFRIFVPQLFAATHLRAVTRTDVVVTSPIVTANVALRVGIAARRAGRKRVRLRGSIRPRVARGRAVLQRRGSRGRWVFVRGKDAHSRYAFVVRRRSRARVYRVRVIARDGGAHVPGTSRKVKVRRL